MPMKRLGTFVFSQVRMVSGRCDQGSTWQVSCNVCSCDQYGNVNCTNEQCEDETDPDRYLERDDLRAKRSTFSNKRCKCLISLTSHSVPYGVFYGTDYELSFRYFPAASRWCKPGDVYLFNCDKCPCRVRGITGCRSVTCRER